MLEYVATGSFDQLNLFSVINELGGWFLKTLIILQFVFGISSKIARKKEYFLITLSVMTTVAIVAMRLIGLQSYYYIDCFAFVFGSASYMYSRQYSMLISNAVIVVLSGLFTIFMGGVPILLQKGILPSRMGIGLIVGFINSFTQVIIYQSLITRFQFKRGNLLKWIGKYSYEIYLAGPCAYIIAITLSRIDIMYYFAYMVLCVVFGVAIHVISNKIPFFLKQ